MCLILKENNPLAVVIWIYTGAGKTIKVSMLIRELKQRRGQRRRQQEGQKSIRFGSAKQQLFFLFLNLYDTVF